MHIAPREGPLNKRVKKGFDGLFVAQDSEPLIPLKPHSSITKADDGNLHIRAAEHSLRTRGPFEATADEMKWNLVVA